ncbi:MAG TPA: carbon starvation CstA family protein, partial [Candidatus Brocadiia bacterium]|nr:carbon starvation CstA family protein [Candidatus Brocadiia bacterium]
PFFTGWHAPDTLGGAPLFPILFITVACGACSGFHSIVASGTTSKQLNRETDAKPVGYGSMLLEGLLAVLSLATLMIIAPRAGGRPLTPNAVFASGIAEFGRRILGPLWPVDGAIAADRGYQILYQFALLCFATFVFDTLDACTRLARYVLGEALKWRTAAGRVWTTVITLALPALALMIPPLKVGGVAQPLWRVFWGIFGSANQLLAALALLGLAAWVGRRRGPWWIAFLPMLFMMTMTLWSIILSITQYAGKWLAGAPLEIMVHVQFFVNALLLVLAVLLMVEGVLTALIIRRERREAAPSC